MMSRRDSSSGLPVQTNDVSVPGNTRTPMGPKTAGQIEESSRQVRLLGPGGSMLARTGSLGAALSAVVVAGMAFRSLGSTAPPTRAIPPTPVPG